MIPADQEGLRIPPHSEEAERGVIGSILLDPCGALIKAQEKGVVSDNFYDRRHQVLYAQLVEMQESGRPMDAITIGDWLKKKNALEKVGGYDYLVQLQDSTLVPAHVGFYSDIVIEKSKRRSLIWAASETIQAAYKGEQDNEAIIESCQSELIRLVGVEDKEQRLPEAVDAMMKDFEMAAKGEKPMFGLPIPFDDLNENMCGIPNGFGVIAARPSQGKTSLEDQLTSYLAGIGIPVGRITMDMTKPRLLQRATCRGAGVSLPKIKKGNVKYGSRQWDAIAEQSRLIKTWPMFINDYDRNLMKICTWIRMVVMKHGVRCVTIDYIQQIRTGARIDADENMRITEVSGTLKELANQLDISIIVLSQLNRGADKDKRIPTMADLRGSGSLEQDAQWIWLLYKDKDTEEAPTLRPTWIEIAKTQDGETCGFPFWFYANYFKFVPAEIGYDGEGNALPFSDRATHLGHQARAAKQEELEVDG